MDNAFNVMQNPNIGFMKENQIELVNNSIIRNAKHYISKEVDYSCSNGYSLEDIKSLYGNEDLYDIVHFPHNLHETKSESESIDIAQDIDRATVFNISNILSANPSRDDTINSFKELLNFPSIHLPYKDVILFSNNHPTIVVATEASDGIFCCRVLEKMTANFKSTGEEVTEIISNGFFTIDMNSISKSNDINKCIGIGTFMSGMIDNELTSRSHAYGTDCASNEISYAKNILKEMNERVKLGDTYALREFVSEIIPYKLKFFSKNVFNTDMPIHIIAEFLKFINCKNITYVNSGKVTTIKRKVQRKVKGKYREYITTPLIEEKILAISNKGKIETLNESSDGRSPSRLHWVRGHFKHYTPERPMGRGKVVGTIYCPAFTRGDKKLGTINKSYECLKEDKE